MRLARIVGGLVAELIEVPSDGPPVEDLFTPEVLAECVPATGNVELGWQWDGQDFAAPPATPSPPAVRVIRSLAFRERLSPEKRAALSVAAMQAAAQGDGTLLTFLLDQASALETDLDDPKVSGGVGVLQAAGLITQAEADAMLADGSVAEAA